MTQFCHGIYITKLVHAINRDYFLQKKKKKKKKKKKHLKIIINSTFMFQTLIAEAVLRLSIIIYKFLIKNKTRTNRYTPANCQF